MSNSSTSKQVSKQHSVPREFPLWLHPNGSWCKKVRGKVHYFGPAGDPQKALEKWLAEKDDLLAGREPRGEQDRATVRDLLNRFLTAKKIASDKGEIARRSLRDYHGTTDRIARVLGVNTVLTSLRASDFESLRADMAKTLSLASMKPEIIRARSVFAYAFDVELVEKPIRFGPAMDVPDGKALKRLRQQQRQTNGPKMFEAAEIRAMLGVANTQMKAMILLGINCGFGNNDCAKLPRSSVDLGGGWINFPRPKTGAERRIPLWKETVEALREVYAKRADAKVPADDGLVFLTKNGTPLIRMNTHGDRPGSWMDRVLNAFKTVKAKLDLKNNGRGFYALRHTTETIGGEARDQVALNYIMGHTDSSMAATYRERIDDSRLKAVTDHIREWLWSNASCAENATSGE